MKTLVSNLIRISALILVIVFFASCRDRNKPKNYFEIEGTTYEIKSAEIFNNGEIDNGFSLDLWLFDEGRNNFLNFTLVSQQAENLTSATYTDFEGLWVKGNNTASINTGKIVVSRSPEGYAIDVKCTDQYSNDVKAYYKGNLQITDKNNLVHTIPDYVLPDEIYDEVSKLIPTYSGSNPPDMKGEYVSSPHALIYESYGAKPDSLQFYSDRYLGFLYTNQQMNFYGKQYDSLENRYIEEIQYGVKITGNNDNFTCYYVVDGYVEGYYAQQSIIFSGKKTDSGLENFHVAVILLETSGNPNMYDKHSYRVLKDYDGLAERNNWLFGRSHNTTATKANSAFDIWMK